MKYTENEIEKKEEFLNSSTKPVGLRLGVSIVRILFFVIIAVVVIGACAAAGVVRGVIASSPDVDSINISPSGYATFIYDSEGNQLQKLTSSDSNRTSVSLENVPEDLQHAIIAIEDARFYEHNGIDPRGILRAAVVGIRNGFRFTEGASTITQQLLKNNVFTTWTEESSLGERIRRKLQEQYLAVELEKKLNDKDLILENYLNTINLGAGTYGVQAASKQYFHKDVSELTLSECAVLACIPQNPSKYNPITHPDYNAERREVVLSRMVAQGYITQDQMDEALEDDVYDRIAAAQETTSDEAEVYSYFIDELTDQVVNDLMDQKGYSESQAYQALYSGGLRIYTTQDMMIQQICDEEFANEENYPDTTYYTIDWALSIMKSDGTTVNHSKEMLRKHFREKLEDEDFDLLFESEDEAQSYIDEYKEDIMETGDEILAERTSFSPQPQASMVVIDQSTGYVKAIVGGRGEKTASLTLNRATDSTRQPGSAFKILTVYSAALDEYDKTLATIMPDEETEYSDGTIVSNYYTDYKGDVTIREGIWRSINTIAIQLVQEMGTKAAFEMATSYGITTLDPIEDMYEPMAIGGLYNGVTNLEMTAAYAAIANGGTYIEPTFYTKILDQDGNVVLDNTPETHRVIKESTAYLLTSAMEDVLDHGTGDNIELDVGDMAVAAKTGSTNNYVDVWVEGFTPYYTVGIWAGYDNNEPLEEDTYYQIFERTIWANVINRISALDVAKQFTIPSTVTQVTVCNETGLLATSYCSDTTTEYFAKGTAPTDYCTVCKSNYEAAAARRAAQEAAERAAAEAAAAAEAESAASSSEDSGDTGSSENSGGDDSGDEDSGGDDSGGGEDG